MKQTIEEDKEPEKSGWTFLFGINERFFWSSSVSIFKFTYQFRTGIKDVFMARVV